jgi:hypothetical protein
LGGKPAASGVTCLPFLQDIAQTSNCVDQFRREGVVYFGSQSPDVYFHEIRIAVEIHIPDLIGNHGAREYVARMPRQQRK